jgi:excisionase family DNA binding protein
MAAAMTPQDVADDLKHPGGKDAILRLLRAGTLPGFKVGMYWRVDPDELSEWKARTAARPSDPNRIAPRSARSQAALARRRGVK